MRRLRRVDVVVFDCDSTLTAVEGIDEMARAAGVDVSGLTAAAMRGELRLEQVYAQRMALVMPDADAVARLGAHYIDHVVADAHALMNALRAEGIQVRIMSGGVRPAVEALGAHLGIPGRHVAAVDVNFNADGAYAGFDHRSPLARAGGKRELLQVWRRELKGTLMFVGDGATDLEAADTADLFVAYAGVVERPNVTAAADVVVRSPSLAPILPLALGGDRPRAPQSQSLYQKGIELLEPVYRSYFRNGSAA